MIKAQQTQRGFLFKPPPYLPKEIDIDKSAQEENLSIVILAYMNSLLHTGKIETKTLKARFPSVPLILGDPA